MYTLLPAPLRTPEAAGWAVGAIRLALTAPLHLASTHLAVDVGRARYTSTLDVWRRVVAEVRREGAAVARHSSSRLGARALTWRRCRESC